MKFFILFCLWIPFISYGGGEVLPLEERTPEVREAIITILKVDGKEVSLSNLSSIKVLSLSTVYITGRYIKSLKPGDFSGLSSLEWLFLSDNELSKLPEGIFSGLSSLRKLSLDRNQLSELPRGIFSGLTALEELRLHGNKLIELPEGVFSGLSSLKRLDLGGNELSESSKKAVRQTTVKDCRILFP